MDPQDFIKRLLTGEGLSLDVQGQPQYADIQGKYTIPIMPDVEAEIRGGMQRDPYQPSGFGGYSGGLTLKKRF